MRKIVSFLFLFALVCASDMAASAKPKQPIKVSCIGNSITYGTGCQHPETDSYPAQLQVLLGDGYQVGNFGKPGATLLRKAYRPYVQQEEYKRALEFAGDIAVIHLGVNDTDPRAWPNYRDDFVQDYFDLIASVRRANPKCRVILARMTPLSDRHHRFQSGTRDWHALIQKCIETVAREANCELIDFYEPLHRRPDLFPDAIHPNVQGYGMLAQIVYSAITGDYGGLQVSPYITDNMVLPRERSFTLRGHANAGEKVRVQLGKTDVTAVANNRGEWNAEIKPLTSGETYSLTLTAKSKTLKFNNILAGELWLCSGQSNMAFQLQSDLQAKKTIAAAQNPNIRILTMLPRYDTSNMQWSAEAVSEVNNLRYYQPATWQECTPDNVPHMSAVGYYFAAELQQRLGCPVGIIGNAVGGSGVEAWIDRTTIEWEFPNILRDWLNNDFIQDWVRGRAATNLGSDHKALDRHPYQPCYLYEASIPQLRDLPIDGVIWYQGESNAHNMESHEQLFHLLLQSWRQTWGNPELPFGFVQLSSLNRPSWPWFRYSQYQIAQKEQHVGMAVSSDQGDSLDVHPRNKQPIGQRLALWALHDVYGQQVEYMGPTPEKYEFIGDKCIITYSHASGLTTSDGKAPATFELAEIEGRYFPAQARIVGNTVVLQSARVSKPKYFRYGWQPFTRANLVNDCLLPASTYRSE